MTVERALIGLTRALTSAGLPVSPDRARRFVEAAAALGVADRSAVFWAGRACLCSDPEQFALYGRVFAAWFAVADRSQPRHLPPARTSQTWTTHAPADVGPGVADPGAADPGAADPGAADPGAADRGAVGPRDPGQDSLDEQVVPGRAADLEVLRHRDVADLTAAERALLAMMFAELRPVSPRRASARQVPARRGRLDGRRMLRAQIRLAGEPGPVRYRRRGWRERPVVLLIDVSGSMAAYADALLRLAHVWVRSRRGGVEVFTIGTRLTRVTVPLRVRDPEQALRAVGDQVPDWSGGTRLGEVLAAFLERWGGRGLVRGAVTVVFSDGWERGDPQLLGREMARLRLISHQVIWVNPHRARPGYRPVQGGMAAALPHCDALLAGHSLETFAELLEVVTRA